MRIRYHKSLSNNLMTQNKESMVYASLRCENDIDNGDNVEGVK